MSGHNFLIEFINDTYPGASREAIRDLLRETLSIVVLTRAEYDALAVKDPNTIYVVKT